MAYHHAHAAHGAEIAHIIWDAVKSGVGAFAEFFVSISAANRRVHMVESLSAKSDAELAALGMRREDIVRYVFRDMLDV